MLKRFIVYTSIFVCFGILLYSYRVDRNPQQSAFEKTTVKPSTMSVNAAIVAKLTVSEQTDINSYCRDIAAYISGHKPDENSKIYPYTNDTAWVNYQKNLASKWEGFYHEKIEYIGQWSKLKLTNVNSQATTVLYPFSGPDFLYMYKFLPDADNYYLFGLEHVGTIPDINKISGKALPGYLQSFNKSLATLIDVSYFITQRMSSELNNAKIDGVLPIMLFFMAQSDVTVTDIKPATIDSEGVINTIKLNTEDLLKTKLGRGVQISFLSPLKKKQTLYYFSGDLQNTGLATKPHISKMLHKIQGEIVTLFKSASYLMHGNNFSTMRNIILNKSKFIIQDDTGMPYKSYTHRDWDLHFFGEYTKPISCFKNYFQKDLATDFPINAEKLDFRFGYNKTSYVLVASKLNATKLLIRPRDLPSEK